MQAGREAVAVDLDDLRWRKSSSSGNTSDHSNCVEVAMIDTALSTAFDIAVTPARTAVRDSKNPGPALTFPPNAWSNLVHRLVC
jgi:hypothetical protein